MLGIRSSSVEPLQVIDRIYEEALASNLCSRKRKKMNSDYTVGCGLENGRSRSGEMRRVL